MATFVSADASPAASVVRRDRTIVVSAVAILTTLAWLYLLHLRSAMPAISGAGGMGSMPGMDMRDLAAVAPGFRPWSPGDFALTLLMWTVMMAGMMLPSASPMILLYAQVGRQAKNEGHIFAATGWFASGYLIAWVGFALCASVAQAALVSAAWITPMLASAGSRFGGTVLIAAGLYQWTPLKDTCLAQCQFPLSFIQRHGGFKGDASGALAVGLRHGLYCIGCCWALMALLFVVGVMNILWIAVLSILVLAEKLVPAGRAISRLAGLVLLGLGVIFLTSTP